jgi:hypothetical protein
VVDPEQRVAIADTPDEQTILVEISVRGARAHRRRLSRPGRLRGSESGSQAAAR